MKFQIILFVILTVTFLGLMFLYQSDQNRKAQEELDMQVVPQSSAITGGPAVRQLTEAADAYGGED